MADSGDSKAQPKKRGRKQDDSLPPSRSRDIQRAFRARRAALLSNLEARVAFLEAENAALRAHCGLAPDGPPLSGPAPQLTAVESATGEIEVPGGPGTLGNGAVARQETPTATAAATPARSARGDGPPPRKRTASAHDLDHDAHDAPSRRSSAASSSARRRVSSPPRAWTGSSAADPQVDAAAEVLLLGLSGSNLSPPADASSAVQRDSSGCELAGGGYPPQGYGPPHMPPLGPPQHSMPMQPNGHGYVFVDGHPHPQAQWQYPPPPQQMSPFPPQQPFQHHPHPHQPQQLPHLPQPPFAGQPSPHSHSQQWAPTSSPSMQQGPPPQQNGFPPPPPNLAQQSPYPPLPALPAPPHYPPHSQHASSFLSASAPSSSAPHSSVQRDQAASSPFTPIEALLHTLQAQPLPASIQHSTRDEQQPQQQHQPLPSLHEYPYDEQGFPVLPPWIGPTSTRPAPGPPPPPRSAPDAHAQPHALAAADEVKPAVDGVGEDASLEAQQRAFLVRACGAPPPPQGARVRKWHAFCEVVISGVLEAEREGRVGALPAAPPPSGASASEGAARPGCGSGEQEERGREAQRARARGSKGASGDGCCEGKVQCAAPVSSERDHPRPSPAPALAAVAAATDAAEECCGGLIDCSGPLFDDTPSYPSAALAAAAIASSTDRDASHAAGDVDEPDPDAEGDVDPDAVADAAAAAYDDAPRWPTPAPSYMPLSEAFALLEPYMADPCPPSSPPPRPSPSLSTSPTSPPTVTADPDRDSSAWGVAPEKLATMLWDTYPSWIAPPGLDLPEGAGRDPPHFAIAPAPAPAPSSGAAGAGAGEAGDGARPPRCDALYVWRWCVDMSARGLAVRDLVVRGVCGEDEAKRRVFAGQERQGGEGKAASEKREEQGEGDRAGLSGESGRARGAGGKCSGRC
ncbi:hypothetical protein JCM9279_004026 [Rhodotorula babjevae]